MIALKRTSFFSPLLACKICSQSELGWALYIRLNITQRFEFEAKYHWQWVNDPFSMTLLFSSPVFFSRYVSRLSFINKTNAKNNTSIINITHIRYPVYLDQHIRFIAFSRFQVFRIFRRLIKRSLFSHFRLHSLNCVPQGGQYNIYEYFRRIYDAVNRCMKRMC